jgi:DNA-binding NarL/FixJ family response regulator
LELIRTERPSVVVVGLVLCGQFVFDLIRDLNTEYPDLNIVVYAGVDGTTYMEQCLKLGVKGFVSRSQPIDELMAAIRNASKGLLYIDQSRFAELLLTKSGIGKPSVTDAVNKLTPCELRVFQFIGRGASSAEIASSLHRSINTIETYRTRIKNKLGLKHASKLAHYAFQHALLADGVEPEKN